MPQTPINTYKRYEREIQMEIRKLKNNLKSHKENFSKDDANWAHVGSLVTIKEQLRNLNNFVKR